MTTTRNRGKAPPEKIIVWGNLISARESPEKMAISARIVEGGLKVRRPISPLGPLARSSRCP